MTKVSPSCSPRQLVRFPSIDTARLYYFLPPLPAAFSASASFSLPVSMSFFPPAESESLLPGFPDRYTSRTLRFPRMSF